MKSFAFAAVLAMAIACLTAAKRVVEQTQAATSTATVQSSSTSRAATGPKEPTTSKSVAKSDADIRTRIVDMQQTLDRLLLDSSTRAVGSSGSSRATVSVDRAKLVHLRHELDDLLVALDSR